MVVLFVLSGGALFVSLVVQFSNALPGPDRRVAAYALAVVSAAFAIPAALLAVRAGREAAGRREPRPWFVPHGLTLALLGYAAVLLLSVSVRSSGMSGPSFSAGTRTTFYYLGFPFEAVLVVSKGKNVIRADDLNWPRPVRPEALAVDLLFALLLVGGVAGACELSLRRGRPRLVRPLPREAPPERRPSQPAPDWAVGRAEARPVPPLREVLPAPGPPEDKGPAALRFPCPKCRTGLKVPAASAGKQVRCPRCREVTVIPSAGP